MNPYETYTTQSNYLGWKSKCYYSKDIQSILNLTVLNKNMTAATSSYLL